MESSDTGNETFTVAEVEQAFNDYHANRTLSERQERAMSRGHDVERFMGDNYWNLTADAALRKAITEVLVRLPEQAFELLVGERGLVVIQGARKANTVYPLPPRPTESWFVVFQSDTAAYTHEQLVGLVAHELAHVANCDGIGDVQAEVKADALAVSWGFASEILAADTVTYTHGRGQTQ